MLQHHQISEDSSTFVKERGVLLVFKFIAASTVFSFCAIKKDFIFLKWLAKWFKS